MYFDMIYNYLNNLMGGGGNSLIFNKLHKKGGKS